MVWVVFIVLSIILLVSIGYLLKAIDLQVPIIAQRSSHTSPAYISGGYFFTLGLILADFLFISNNEIQLIIFGAIGFGIIGILDDVIEIHFRWKLTFQILFTLIFLYQTDLYLTNLDFGFTSIFVGWGGLIITTMAVLLVVNAFNYFDGLDGLYLFMFLSMLAVQLGILQWHQKTQLYVALAILSGIFLTGNFSFFSLPKQFLGDGGNYILSFLICMIYLLEAQSNQIMTNINLQVFGLWFFGLLFFEFVAVCIIRLKKGLSIFHPGKDHLHHLINSTLSNHFFTSLLITFIYLIIIFFGVVVTLMLPKLSFILFVLVLFLYVILRLLENKRGERTTKN